MNGLCTSLSRSCVAAGYMLPSTMDVLEPMDVSESAKCVGAENLRYKSSFPYRGIAVIAIFSKFRSKELENISYAKIDRKLLEKGFTDQQYGVVVWEDMEKEKFFQRLKLVSDDDELHEKCESFALAIVTHGHKNGKLHAFDTCFRREDVYSQFKAENCRGLKNKLKLFIFHACRGDTWSEGVHLSGNRRHEVQRARLGDYIEKDNLILCSTTEDNVAFAPNKDGSPFIRCLHHVMKEEAGKQDGERQHMLDLLTDVINYTTDFNVPYNKRIYVQQPVLMYSLDQFYHFNKKEVFPEELLQKHQYL
ncbi:hypothetical protein J437_LFUL003923 [Ladona fulva]|uniref:Caspase family p20 domain-containing protein n=1 Tax=Ladona fulva TaxID=123851 RepID=A0A8K0K9Q7_LADFU|nr:hypothetical protein J437_LFUL003923 [Ladona fulva]